MARSKINVVTGTPICCSLYISVYSVKVYLADCVTSFAADPF